MASFKERIKALRQEAGMRQVDLANEINCSKSTISLWERGEVEPEYAMLERLCRCFNTTMGYLKGTNDVRYAISDEPAVWGFDETAFIWTEFFNRIMHLSPKSQDILMKVINACAESDMKDGQYQKEDYYCVTVEKK